MLLRLGLDPRVLQGGSLGSPNGDSPLADGPLLAASGLFWSFPWVLFRLLCGVLTMPWGKQT